jgi:predicted transcriptional regulator
MEIRFSTETERKLKDLATQSGRGTDDLVEDAMAAYLEEVVQVRDTLDSRYDDLKGGRVKPFDGEEFFDKLRRREDELLSKRLPQ